MKCPCCGEQSNMPYLIAGNLIYFPDGTQRRFKPYPLMYFQKMLRGETIKPKERSAISNSLFVHMSRLREFLKENNMPYTVVFKDGAYSLKMHTS